MKLLLLGIQCITIAIAFFLILRRIRWPYNDWRKPHALFFEAEVVFAVIILILVGLGLIAQYFGLVPI